MQQDVRCGEFYTSLTAGVRIFFYNFSVFPKFYIIIFALWGWGVMGVEDVTKKKKSRDIFSNKRNNTRPPKSLVSAAHNQIIRSWCPSLFLLISVCSSLKALLSTLSWSPSFASHHPWALLLLPCLREQSPPPGPHS